MILKRQYCFLRNITITCNDKIYKSYCILTHLENGSDPDFVACRRNCPKVGVKEATINYNSPHVTGIIHIVGYSTLAQIIAITINWYSKGNESVEQRTNVVIWTAYLIMRAKGLISNLHIEYSWYYTFTKVLNYFIADTRLTQLKLMLKKNSSEKLFIISFRFWYRHFIDVNFIQTPYIEINKPLNNFNNSLTFLNKIAYGNL